MIVNPSLIDLNEFGKVIETLVVIKTNAEFFWRDQYKNEVDLVLNTNSILPIEVKYKNIDTKGITLFMNKFKAKRGIIVTNEREEIIQKIEVMPLFKFLLNFTIPP